MSPVPVFRAPSGSLTSSILRGLVSINKENKKQCMKNKHRQSVILDGLVLLDDGLLLRLSLLCQFEVRFE